MNIKTRLASLERRMNHGGVRYLISPVPAGYCDQKKTNGAMTEREWIKKHCERDIRGRVHNEISSSRSQS